MQEEQTSGGVRSRHVLIGVSVAVFLLLVLCCAGAAFLFGARSQNFSSYSVPYEEYELVGSGLPASVARKVPAFSRVSVDGAVRVVITIGEQRSVVVEADDNLVESVRTDVTGDELDISTSIGWSSALGIVVRVAVPTLESVDARGAASVEITGFSGPSFQVTAIGAAKVTASGATEELGVDAGGAAQVDLSELSSEDARVDATEAAAVDVQASNSLNASASNAAKVRHSGAATVTKRVTEAGTVEKRE